MRELYVVGMNAKTIDSVSNVDGRRDDSKSFSCICDLCRICHLRLLRFVSGFWNVIER